MLGIGVGVVFAGWITGEKGEWEVVFNAIVLTIAMACLLGGVSIFWSDHLRKEAEWTQKCLIIESFNLIDFTAAGEFIEKPSKEENLVKNDLLETNQNQYSF